MSQSPSSPVSNVSDGPLSGLRIIDLTDQALGPIATQLLGDMGGDVIKVEPPSGAVT